MAQSKNDPSKRKGKQGAAQKTYRGKPIRPVLYIYRGGPEELRRYKYMAAEYEDGTIIEDESGNPIRWNQIG
ncbi:MAG: hypothetical protein HRK26_01415 [Rickettsiaceae bacterium H1]|nr:hypothetical protein [Rickettsiaceae bacterium H1]